MSTVRSEKAGESYTFLGTTQSLCPECLSVVPAKIIARGKRVYFRKRCNSHGVREDFICSDRDWYDRYDYALPAKKPKQTFVEPKNGCPLDCGLCSDHEQHTCIGVLELTDHCNLSCPVCYAGSSPQQKHKSIDDLRHAIDRLVQAEGRADVLQLSGGEPTTHPQFEEILDYALEQPIDYIMINTNGIRLAKDREFVDRIAQHSNRVEIYLQWDGTNDEVHRALRGVPLQSIKEKALANLTDAGLNATLVAAMQAGVNDREYGPLLDLCASNPSISGLSLQPATYSGRTMVPEDLETRITAPDCIQGICEQSGGTFVDSDFFPLPCAHPNCHVLALAFRFEGKLVPLTRFVDAKPNLDLLANGLSFTREEGQRLVQQYLARQNCCGPSGCCDTGSASTASSEASPVELAALGGHSLKQLECVDPRDLSMDPIDRAAEEFFAKAIQKELGGKQIFRITITSFLDAYNFDVRRVMKCCTHHVLPSGHIVPFCAYNVLYRKGHIPLPPLSK